MSKVTAIVLDPEGSEIHRVERTKIHRAMLSAKGLQVKTRWVSDQDAEVYYEFDPGTTIHCEGMIEVWDGSEWTEPPVLIDQAPAAPGVPPAPEVNDGEE